MTIRRRPPGIARTLSERARATRPDTIAPDGTESPVPEAIGGIVESLREMVKRLGSLAEAAGEANPSASSTGEKRFDTPLGEGRMVFGWNIRFGQDGVSKAEPFGNVHPGAKSPEPDAPRQPIVDVFEEPNDLVVVAEVPGLEAADIEASVTQDGALSIEAKGARRYSRIVPLPAPVDPASIRISCRNGILELRLARAGGGQP